MLTGCAVETGYVDGRPARVYEAGPGPGYYAPEPVYGGGTTVIAVERNRYGSRGRDDRDRSRTSGYRRSGDGRSGRDRSGSREYGRSRDARGRSETPARVNRRGGGPARDAAPAAERRPDSRKKNDRKKQDQH